MYVRGCSTWLIVRSNRIIILTTHPPHTYILYVQGKFILARFRAFVERSLGHAQRGLMADAGAVVGVMEDYARKGQEDPEWMDLFAAAEAGDGVAANAIHDKVFDELWGGVIDREQLGFAPSGGGGGSPREPAATARLRALVREEEPALWELMTQGDPFLDAMLTNPMAPLTMAQRLTAEELEAGPEAEV